MTNYKPKILVLDEDLLALELYARELSMDYEVVTSSSVGESLEHLAAYQPDVVVIEPPPGCIFHPRCNYAQPVCKVEEPQLQEIVPGHYASCHFANSLSLRGIGGPA